MLLKRDPRRISLVERLDLQMRFFEFLLDVLNLELVQQAAFFRQDGQAFSMLPTM